jgi:hypothetical protein
MDEKLVCPNADKGLPEPQEDSPMTEACAECPALLKEMDERGIVSYYCRVYKNRFRSPGAAIPIATRPPTRASWSRERNAK